MARKSQLETTPGLGPLLIRLLRAGHSQKRACSVAGITQDQLDHWLDQGRNNPNARPVFKNFAAEVDASFDVGIVNLERIIEAHALGDWKAAQFLLAVREPSKYAQQKTVHVGGTPDGIPIRTKAEPTINFDDWPAEEIETYLGVMQRMGVSGTE